MLCFFSLDVPSLLHVIVAAFNGSVAGEVDNAADDPRIGAGSSAFLTVWETCRLSHGNKRSQRFYRRMSKPGPTHVRTSTPF